MFELYSLLCRSEFVVVDTSDTSPGKHLFLISKMIFAGSKDPSNVEFKSENEFTGLQERLELQASNAKSGASADLLAALQRALDAQRERDALAQQLASLQRSMQRRRNEEEVRRQQTESDLEDTRNQLSQLQVRSSVVCIYA